MKEGRGGGEEISVNRLDLFINSKRMRFVITELCAPLNSRADTQSEINHAKYIRSHVYLDE